MSHGHHHETSSGSARSPLAARVRAMEALLVEKGVVTEAEIQDNIRYMDSRSPANGARLVAHAWTDEGFKARLLSDGKAAAIEFGIDAVASPELVVVENTPEVHNLIVCTLCSCYPRNVLGRPPDWYKSFEYRSRAVREPRAVMREFGFEPPGETRVAVHDSTADVRYMVLPMRPPGTEGLDEEGLADLVTRDCLIGVNVPRTPALAG
ncbi:nitrile hydratase subunit alpha [Rubrobacter tropicus]|uniref:nitrile hydratase n=1 Tax=Rubrobacter tropicus TaxID=2653851 RepID=A0A6G8Q6N5_9ACTN|nr:nitrile hydratase subunit alpha [Rubrobacter tropicus]QIN82113.1 nitrile hydratase subunit alpha [Rubrobacter tropicus]